MGSAHLLMKHKIFVLILLSLTGLAATTVSISPNPIIVQQGQQFNAAVNMDTPDVLHAFELSLRYDSSMLQYVNVTRGNMFDGQPIFWWVVKTDTLNTVRVTCIITGQTHTTGPGTLLNFTFTAQNEGCTQLEVAWMMHFTMDPYPFAVADLRPADVFIGTQVSYGKIKAFLQGPFDDGGMTNSLNPLLPLISPFAEDPVSVSDIPYDVVDWVLLELRTDQDAEPVYIKSMWMDKRGYLKIPGKTLLAMTNSPPGPYYVKLKHRNHIPISSAQAFLLSTAGVPTELDLSLSANILVPNAAISVAPGVMALRAGDADQNGAVGNNDRDLYWRLQAGKQGYLEADFDLDGNVFPNDLNALWRPNLQVFQNPHRTEYEHRIVFHLENPRLRKEQEEEYLWLDLMVSADPGEYGLGTGMLLLEYSSEAFGTNLVFAERLEVVPGALLAEGFHNAFNFICNDNQPNRAAIVFEYTGGAQGPIVNGVKACLLQLRIKLEDLSGDYWLNFSPELMQHQQYMANNIDSFELVKTLVCDLVFAPRELKIEVQEGFVTLSWEQIPGHLYNVYSSEDPVFGAWNPEAVELMNSTWTEPVMQNRKFYYVTGSKTNTGF